VTKIGEMCCKLESWATSLGRNCNLGGQKIMLIFPCPRLSAFTFSHLSLGSQKKWWLRIPIPCISHGNKSSLPRWTVEA